MKKIFLILTGIAVMLFSQDGITGTDSTAAVVKETPRINKYIDSFFNGKNLNIEELLMSDDPEINGFMRNIQVAPFDDRVISFEATYKNNGTVKIFLFNTESQLLLQVTSAESPNGFEMQDMGVRWHPEKNWFVFYGNGREQREQIYVAEVVVPELFNKAAVRTYPVNFKKESDTIDYCLYPTLNATGNELYFCVKSISEAKGRKYRPNFNIAHVEDIFGYLDSGFKDVEYEIILQEKYDQVNPICSPTDPDLFAYISYKKAFKKDRGYAYYAIEIYNKRDKKITTVDKLNGFKDYEYQWNQTGDMIFYYAAHSLTETPKKFKDDRINILNLHAARIEKKLETIVNNDDSEKKEEVLSVEILKNPYGEAIMGDVVAKSHGLAFVDSNRFLMSKYDPYNSIFLVDIDMWKSEGFYIKKLPYQKDIDLPILTKDSFLFVRYDYYDDVTLTTICRIKCPLE